MVMSAIPAEALQASRVDGGLPDLHHACQAALLEHEDLVIFRVGVVQAHAEAPIDILPQRPSLQYTEEA